MYLVHTLSSLSRSLSLSLSHGTSSSEYEAHLTGVYLFPCYQRAKERPRMRTSRMVHVTWEGIGDS